MKNLDYYIAIGYKVINSYLGLNTLAHHGIKGQKWGVRRYQNYDGSLTPEGKERYTKNNKVSMNLQNFASNKALSIRDPSTGERYNLIDGSHIWNKHVFYGKGCSTPINEDKIDYLLDRYGGEEKEWEKVKGIGDLDYHGEPRRAEIHWYHENSVGEVDHKVKKWLEN